MLKSSEKEEQTMKRRTLTIKKEVKTMFRDLNMEKIAPGWKRSNSGLATSALEIDQVLEEMNVLPPRISQSQPSAPIQRKTKHWLYWILAVLLFSWIFKT